MSPNKGLLFSTVCLPSTVFTCLLPHSGFHCFHCSGSGSRIKEGPVWHYAASWCLNKWPQITSASDQHEPLQVCWTMRWKSECVELWSFTSLPISKSADWALGSQAGLRPRAPTLTQSAALEKGLTNFEVDTLSSQLSSTALLSSSMNVSGLSSRLNAGLSIQGPVGGHRIQMG